MTLAQNLVIIPTYNEKENIENIIRKVFSLGDFHILVVEDNSPDGTANIIKQLQTNFPHSLHILERKGKLGLGTAYIAGFQWALDNDYEYIFEMDADFSHNPEDLPRLLEGIKNGFDLAIGSRYISGVNVVNWPMNRVLMSFFASKYVKFITGMPIKDTTAGFKCYRRKVLETINLDKIQMIGYGFQIEMKFKVWLHQFRIIEVPIIFTDRKQGASKMSSGIFGEAFWGVIRMKLNSIFKKQKTL